MYVAAPIAQKKRARRATRKPTAAISAAKQSAPPLTNADTQDHSSPDPVDEPAAKKARLTTSSPRSKRSIPPRSTKRPVPTTTPSNSVLDMLPVPVETDQTTLVSRNPLEQNPIQRPGTVSDPVPEQLYPSSSSSHIALADTGPLFPMHPASATAPTAQPLLSPFNPQPGPSILGRRAFHPNHPDVFWCDQQRPPSSFMHPDFVRQVLLRTPPPARPPIRYAMRAPLLQPRLSPVDDTTSPPPASAVYNENLEPVLPDRASRARLDDASLPVLRNALPANTQLPNSLRTPLMAPPLQADTKPRTLHPPHVSFQRFSTPPPTFEEIAAEMDDQHPPLLPPHVVATIEAHRAARAKAESNARSPPPVQPWLSVQGADPDWRIEGMSKAQYNHLRTQDTHQRKMLLHFPGRGTQYAAIGDQMALAKALLARRYVFDPDLLRMYAAQPEIAHNAPDLAPFVVIAYGPPNPIIADIIERGWHSDHTVTLHAMPFECIPPKFVAIWEHLERLEAKDETEAADAFKALLSSPAIKEAIRGFVHRDLTSPKKTIWTGVDEETATRRVIGSLVVRKLPRCLPGYENAPLLAVYIDPPTHNVEHWKWFRDYIQTLHVGGVNTGYLQPHYERVRCLLCHAQDHFTDLCLAPSMDGYRGPSIDDVLTQATHRRPEDEAALNRRQALRDAPKRDAYREQPRDVHRDPPRDNRRHNSNTHVGNRRGRGPPYDGPSGRHYNGPSGPY